MTEEESVPAALQRKVFEEFLAEIQKAEIPADVIDRLRKALLVDATFSDTALRAALFGENPPA